MLAPKTLDISEPQVLVFVEEADEGRQRQHRVLLHRIAGGRWVTLEPDENIEIHSLGEERHTVLARNSAFPRGQDYAGHIYALDPLSRAALLRAKGLAKTQAMLLADGDVPEEVKLAWVIVEPGVSGTGNVVRDEDLDDPERFTAMQSRGLLEVDGAVWLCARMERDKAAAILHERSDAEQDYRVVGWRLASGKRNNLSLVDAVEAFSEHELAGWPFLGDNAATEYLTSIANAQGNIVSYEAEWSKVSGVLETSQCYQEHRNISEVLRLAHSVDHVNIPSLACFEQLIRRRIQIEMAVERNPKAPDFSGLHPVLGGSTTAKGANRAPKFREWVAAKQREEGQTLKHARLLREEAAKRGPKGKGKDDT